jgi:sugar (pentulose or hexulose) kinase
LRCKRNLDCLNQVQGCGKIVLSGGLSKLDIFCQCLADVTEKIVLRCDDVEACARGASDAIVARNGFQAPIIVNIFPAETRRRGNATDNGRQQWIFLSSTG